MTCKTIAKTGLYLSLALTITSCGTLPSRVWGAQPYLQKTTIDSKEVNQKINKSIENIMGKKGNEYRLVRNSLQDYLKYVSNQNCHYYKGSSLFTQSNINFSLGSAATLLGAAGGVTSGGLTQALSVSTSAITGVQSQVNQNYYREKTFEVITRAIDTRRKIIWADIENRRIQDLESDNYSYTIEGAIADAVEYNGACSLIAGLESLEESVAMQDENVEKAKDEQKNMAENVKVDDAELSTQQKDNITKNTLSAVRGVTKEQSKKMGKFRTIKEILATQ